MRISSIFVVILTTAITVGCQKSTRTYYAAPVTPAPALPVDTALLAPIESPSQSNTELRGATEQNDAAIVDETETAKATINTLSPTNSGADITKADLTGGWTLSSAGASCQLIMSQTSWTGGHRAITRGCTTSPLNAVSAWQLNGKQLVLISEGSAAARLYRVGDTQFSGSTVLNGQVVRVFR